MAQETQEQDGRNSGEMTEPEESHVELIRRKIRRCHLCGASCEYECAYCEQFYKALAVVIRQQPLAPGFWRRLFQRIWRKTGGRITAWRRCEKHLRKLLTPPCEVSFATLLAILEALLKRPVNDVEELCELQKKRLRRVEMKACTICGTMPIGEIAWCIQCGDSVRNLIYPASTDQMDRRTRMREIRNLCRPPFITLFRDIFRTVSEIRKKEGRETKPITLKQFAALTDNHSR